MKYFVVMVDYGRPYFGKKGPSGYEALPVQPELTRREIIEQVRDVLASDHLTLVHVKLIDGNDCDDQTIEITSDASYANAMAAIDAALSPVDQQAVEHDRISDYRKHQERV